MLVALIGELPEPRYDFVLVCEEVPEGRRRIRRYDRLTGGHGKRYAALGFLDMIEPIAILRHPILMIVRLMRGRHDSILQCQMLELVRLEQRVAGAEKGTHALTLAQSAKPAND